MFINKRLYIAVIGIIFCFLIAYKSILMLTVGQVLLLLLVLLCIYDYILLFKRGGNIQCSRECPERFSNGDKNEIRLHLSNSFSFPVSLRIIDEIPPEFQLRDVFFEMDMKTEEAKVLVYSLRPVRRGIYKFGIINVLVSSQLGLLSRRIKTGAPSKVKVYPSYLCLRQYELLAISNKLIAPGLKRVRKIGQQLEPEQIREYVKDDDFRTINWKATARRSKLMVNVFQEERAQNIYSLIDKGRTMQAACEGMSLLDYSINASLALSYVAMIKGDKVGLLTFEKQPETIIKASRQPGQLLKISEALYNQTNTFSESDFSALYQCVNNDIRSRSLLIIYTNFDTVSAMKRQLTFLSIIAKRHTVVVVFFENTEIQSIAGVQPTNKEEAYQKVIAEKIAYEKTLIISKLRNANIISILSHPTKLTVEVVNKYLEIKARGVN